MMGHSVSYPRISFYYCISHDPEIALQEVRGG